MRPSSFVSSSTVGRMGSASTSTNSLFSLDKRTYSALWQGRANYYYQNGEIDESDHEDVLYGMEGLDSTRSQSPLTFEFPAKRRKVPKFVFMLVGLPAVGKSSTSEHLIEFLKSEPATKDLRCSVYNAGKVRRSMSFQNLGLLSMQLANDSSEDLFSPKNYNKKELYAKITLEKLLTDLDSDVCDVAIFDATNSCVNRRKYVFEQICSYNQKRNTTFCITPIVLQISCNDSDFIKFNVHNKSFNADYYDKPYEYAVRDFAKRMRHYHSQFTPFTKEEFLQLSEWVNSGGLDYGVFSFSIVNAGTIPTREQSMGVLPIQRGEVRTMEKLVGQFIEHYTKMFGHFYVDRVHQFFDREATGGSEHLSVLNSVMNQELLEEMQGNLEFNMWS